MSRHTLKLRPVLLTALVWLIIWQLGAVLLNQDLLLPQPLQVGKALLRLVSTASFWISIAHSLFTMALGWVASWLVGCVLVALALWQRPLRVGLDITLSALRAAPVASFIVLLFVWLNSSTLAAAISFLMALPVVYTSLVEAFSSTDGKLKEMAQTFSLPQKTYVHYVLLPQIMASLKGALVVSQGLAWKAGIAAEVIANAKQTIGAGIFGAKVYFETPELFAWTFVIMLLSSALEHLTLRALRYVDQRRARSYPRVGSMSSASRAAAHHLLQLSLPAVVHDNHIILAAQTLALDATHPLILTGASGLGKTTLMHKVLDAARSLPAQTMVVSCVWQEDRLIPTATVEANLKLCAHRFAGTDARFDEDAYVLLDKLGLERSLYKQTVSHLSGGQKRRVVLARALLVDADLYLFDEALTSLDATLKMQVITYVAERLSGKRLLWITHDTTDNQAFCNSVSLTLCDGFIVSL